MGEIGVSDFYWDGRWYTNVCTVSLMYIRTIVSWTTLGIKLMIS